MDRWMFIGVAASSGRPVRGAAAIDLCANAGVDGRAANAANASDPATAADGAAAASCAARTGADSNGAAAVSPRAGATDRACRPRRCRRR